MARFRSALCPLRIAPPCRAAEIEAAPAPNASPSPAAPWYVRRGGGIQRRRKQRRQRHINPACTAQLTKWRRRAVAQAEHRQTVVMAAGRAGRCCATRCATGVCGGSRRHQMQRQLWPRPAPRRSGHQQPQGQRKVAGQLRVGRWRQGRRHRLPLIAAGGEKRRCGSGISGSGNKPGSVVR